MTNLFTMLKVYAEENKCKIYLAKIKYNLHDDAILEIVPNFNTFPKTSEKRDEKFYLYLMTLKRPAFRYENEYRLFIVPQKGSPLDIAKDIIKVPIDASVFSEFIISPLDMYENKEDLSSKIKKSLYKYKVDIIKDFIKGRAPDAIVDNSRLYENVIRNCGHYVQLDY